MKIAIVGECFGEEEERYGKPFIGKAGEALNAMLSDAGINRSDCFITNVFNLRPANNNLEELCTDKKNPNAVGSYSSLTKGKYLRREFLPELDRLYSELDKLRPNLVILLGNTASWAILGTTGISKIRGTCCWSKYGPKLKCLLTYHPTAVLRAYDLRHIAVIDLMKARREAESPELIRPNRELWLDPSLEDMERFYETYIKNSSYCAFDVETAFQQITCIGFAPSIDRGIIIPFLDYRYPKGHYWKTLEEEIKAWDWVRKALSAKTRYVAQNGLYDVQYLWNQYGIPARVDEDTMLLHHSLQPESLKSLAFLGSVYSNEIAWKPERPNSKHSEKPGDEE